VLHLDRIADPTRLAKAVVDAGGEILERFRIPRARSTSASPNSSTPAKTSP
jgi:hypothetical protein